MGAAAVLAVAVAVAPIGARQPAHSRAEGAGPTEE